eukprot:2379354-Amphidinium_carterae.1
MDFFISAKSLGLHQLQTRLQRTIRQTKPGMAIVSMDGVRVTDFHSAMAASFDVDSTQLDPCLARMWNNQSLKGTTSQRTRLVTLKQGYNTSLASPSL